MNNDNDRLLTADELADFLDVPIKALYARRGVPQRTLSAEC